ncbi:hypothetical protein XENOCAPTIV_001447 [Xenoophorus captivus]|uniref:Serpin domain-containing protein n=1 Tax=Xenoophorus captivus TaxID=1517983 RepID=A0ABV0S4H3_9TELE
MRTAGHLLILALLPLLCTAQLLDICNARPKDLALEPRCVYRSPDPDEPDKPTPEPRPVNPRVWELSKANSRFALSLYKQMALSRAPESNIFMSPLSISTAFAMTKLGACNRTLEQIMKEKTSDMIHFFFAKLNCRLYRRKDKTTVLVSANRLFGDKSLYFNQTYQNISKAVYGAKLMPLNFKGQWKNKFPKENVIASNFYVDESLTCQVNMMFQEIKFNYKDLPDEKVQLLEMPYRGDDITMVIILPNRGHPLSQVVLVEENLDQNKLNSWLNQMRETTVSVTMPRFRVEDSFSLKEKLQQMGLTDLFSAEKARILEDGSNTLFISDAYHKAFLEVSHTKFMFPVCFHSNITLATQSADNTVNMLEESGGQDCRCLVFFCVQVNEEGSEAAATTVVMAVGRSFNLNREFFQADHPFLVIIRESTLNTVLFIGRVSNPCGQ